MQEAKDLGNCDIEYCELKAEVMLRNGFCYCTDCYLDHIIKTVKEKQE